MSGKRVTLVFRAGIAVLAFWLGTGGAQGAERLKPMPDETDPQFLAKNQYAVVIRWAHPHYPAEPKARWKEEFVRVAYIVDENGIVRAAQVVTGPERFRAAALAAIEQWQFRPKTINGHPAKGGCETVFRFTPKGTPREMPFLTPYPTSIPELIPAQEPDNPEPIYPALLNPRRLSGSVRLDVSVNEAGRVDGVAFHYATHPEFVSAALETIAQWQCRPARQGLAPERGQLQAELTFASVDGSTGRSTRGSWLEGNGIVLRDAPGDLSAEYFDRFPEAVLMVDPIYPYELAQAGTTGTARVAFSVNLEGRVVAVHVEEATAPEFGEALAAGIEAWQFKPLQRDGHVVPADFTMVWKFAPPRPGSIEGRLLENPDTVLSAAKLDRPIYPLLRRPAVYPVSRLSSGEAGEVVVEMIIDRDGRVRWPRIHRATHPDFGWAALTGVSQWFFESPTKAGVPIDVRVLTTIRFAPRPAEPGISKRDLEAQ
jgi:TonB family protein